ncbi:glycosyl transferase family 2 [Rhizobium sp. R72]|uniref:glycosyltransferase family 2 protein n=1 Tax=unclassified Rhizobium TaxID=2613769 RepID=UPI000B52C9B9|nr:MULTISPECIES: glycosyltransferase family 2 protein [unclassified Rhizobium]OWW02294.1 glycosyl transferase family 2 [Rhizobium sp. R72]OWW02428.1 glycosyl transferase family 2 [Rhizobium sp. R711]
MMEINGMLSLPRRLLTALRARLRGSADIPVRAATSGKLTYANWVSRYATIGRPERRRLIELQQKLVEYPLMSVLIDGNNASPEQIELSLRSIGEQTYDRWEALVVNPPAQFQAKKGGIRYQVFSTRRADRVAFEELLDAASGMYIVPIAAGDQLSPAALTAFVLGFSERPDTKAIYSDEDRIDSIGQRSDPWFKGAWSPDQVLAQAYTLRSCALNRETILSARLQDADTSSLTDAVYAIWLWLAAQAEASIQHLPLVLYHRRADAPRSEPITFADAVQASPLARKYGLEIRSNCSTEGGWRRVVWPTPNPAPRISLCVPTRDRPQLLSNCIEGLRHRTDWPDLEILIVDNGSSEAETLAYLESLVGDPRVRVLRDDGPFNFSRLNNLGAAASTGALFGLINNDLAVKEPTWLREMASHAVRADVGAVGALLHYGNDTVQHAGVVLGIGGVASHIHKGLPAGQAGYHGRVTLAQDVTCVTAACLITRRDVYQRLGGLDEQRFPVAYNDVDFCLRVRSNGFRVIYTPYAHLYHLESASRGRDDVGTRRARLELDKATILERWGTKIAEDPFYSPNLSNNATDCRLAFPPRVALPWAQGSR